MTKELTKTDVIRNWLEENPDGTYKQFAEEYDGDDIKSSYFSLIKGKINKAEKEPPKRKKKTAKKTTKKAKSTNGRKKKVTKKAKSNNQTKNRVSALDKRLDKFLDDQEGFLHWVQAGRNCGWFKRLQDRLNK